jgi:hypothetical protein
MGLPSAAAEYAGAVLLAAQAASRVDLHDTGRRRPLHTPALHAKAAPHFLVTGEVVTMAVAAASGLWHRFSKHDGERLVLPHHPQRHILSLP